MTGVGIGELYSEVLSEPASLTFHQKRKQTLARPGSIFVGAGDSYAAALAGFYSSEGRDVALDPYTLSEEPSLAEGSEVYFISVSGRTASNVAAAGKVARFAKKTTSITAVEGSPLARATDETITLPMEYRPRTPGLLSFCLSLLTVIRLSGHRSACDFRRAMETARRNFRSVSFGRGTTYFLGNSLAHPAAFYAAAKTHEILGKKAHAEILEEFSHVELMSLSKNDSVNAFASFDGERVGSKLTGVLRGQGYSAHAIGVGRTTPTGALFSSVFAVQLAVLGQARRRGLDRPKFLDLGGRLRASDVMIY